MKITSYNSSDLASKKLTNISRLQLNKISENINPDYYVVLTYYSWWNRVLMHNYGGYLLGYVFGSVFYVQFIFKKEIDENNSKVEKLKNELGIKEICYW
jgi:hypothetical protein